MGTNDGWPAEVNRDLLGRMQGFAFRPIVRVARCRPKGLWVSSFRGVKVHMYSVAAVAWNRRGDVRLGVITRCGQYLHNAISATHPDDENLCDRCLFAEAGGGAAVYQFINAADEVIYVGVSINPINRLTGHMTMSQSTWWSEVASSRIEFFTSELAARREERRLIAELRPKHNIDGNPDRKSARGRRLSVSHVA